MKEADKLGVIITFRRSKEYSPELQQMLKMLLPDRKHSAQMRKMMMTLWSSSPESVEFLRGCCFRVISECNLAGGLCPFKARTIDIFCGRSCNNFVAIRVYVFQTLVSKAAEF